METTASYLFFLSTMFLSSTNRKAKLAKAGQSSLPPPVAVGNDKTSTYGSTPPPPAHTLPGRDSPAETYEIPSLPTPDLNHNSKRPSDRFKLSSCTSHLCEFC